MEVQGGHRLHSKDSFVQAGDISGHILMTSPSVRCCVFPLQIYDNQRVFFFFFLIRIICNFRFWVLFLGPAHFRPTPVESFSLRLHLF